MSGSEKEKRASIVELPYIGEVIEVEPAAVTLTLTASAQEVGNQIHVGDLVVIETEQDAVVGILSDLISKSDGSSITTAGRVSIISTVALKSLSISPGVSQLPYIGARAYRPVPEVIKAVVEDRRQIFENGDETLRVPLAQTTDRSKVQLSFPPERLFGRHCAVLGTSGAGKSWTVAKLTEECAKFRSKIILIDPTGEYESLDQGVFHLHLGEAHRPTPRSAQAGLPYRELNEGDMVAIFRPSNGIQFMKLRTAIRSLKLLALEPKLGAEGNFLKAHKNKVQFEQAMEHYKHELEHSANAFDITKLPLQIEMECVDPIRSQVEPNCWGGTNQLDQSTCVPLINRVQDIITTPELASIFNPGKSPSVFEAIKHFIHDDRISVLRISLEFLPPTHRVREIVANSLGRYLLQMGRKAKFKTQPVLVILDEAHQALNHQLSDLSHDFPLEAFNVIAKEGRKYGLTVCIATQRPRDIPEDVLSQVGTFIVHRLVNDNDRRTVERASGAAHERILESLPALSSGEAFILGIDFPNPIRVKIRNPEKPPHSDGPDYQKHWRSSSVRSTK